jgi:hypothetical protein
VAEGEVLVVKPSDAGSTVGVTIVRKEEELGDAVREAERFGGTVLVEDYIPGKELTVTVWDDGSGPSAFPVVEIRPKGLSTPTRRNIPPFPANISSPRRSTRRPPTRFGASPWKPIGLRGARSTAGWIFASILKEARGFSR